MSISDINLDKKRQVVALVQANNVDAAKMLCAEICASDEQDAEAWYLLGGINGRLGLLEEGVNCCRKSLSLHPDLPEALFNLGLALMEQGKAEEAAACFRQVMDKQPQNKMAVDYYYQATGRMSSPGTGRKLHIGGKQTAAGWEVLNAVPAPYVDHLGNARDLSKFPDNTFTDVYASHVLEHMDYMRELELTLKEWHRVLKPGGKVYISVPDMDVLAKLYLMKDRLSFDERYDVMRMMFGGHVDRYDYHVVGLNLELLEYYLITCGFVNPRRVERLNIFNDTSGIVFKDVLISLNMIAEKPAATVQPADNPV